MARNETPRLRRRRPGRRVPPAVPLPRAGTVAEPWLDEVALVHGWLRRLSPTVEEAEDLTVAVLTRARRAGPALLDAASRQTRLQFLTVQAVLGHRGVR
ncbi:MAG: hypothetical protein ACXVGD_18105 [Blastococcus sp.]